MAVKKNAKPVVKAAPAKLVQTKHACAKCASGIMSNDIASWLHVWYEGLAKRSSMRQYHKKCAPSIAADSGRSR